ncbi:hypothetical protein SAZ11_61150 [Streptomyces sp. FXJ1.4098]|nr:hypothetical protein [Streptomyces sp. FXJ1.4098]
MTETETSRTEEFDAPPLRRLRYFHGQMLGARDFQREQDYHREKLRLRMRCLLGYGVVCGLHVEPAPRDEDDCPPDATAPPEESVTEGDAQPERTRRRPRCRSLPVSPWTVTATRSWCAAAA